MSQEEVNQTVRSGSAPFRCGADPWTWVERLECMGRVIQRHVSVMLREQHCGLSDIVAEEGGDTIYAIDRRVDPIVEQCVAKWPAECLPFTLICEGLGSDGRRCVGDASVPSKFRVIVDPIDGTRALMYDKRSAWFIGAVAVDRGETTGIGDIFASVLVELPTSKQSACDTISAVRGHDVRRRRESLSGETAVELKPRPTSSVVLAGGFGHVVNFFQGTRILAAELMERIAAACVPDHRSAATAIFDDQYISTAGQMVELVTGRDRFCCDLRPLLLAIARRESLAELPELVCHPYDVVGAMVAEQAGVIIADPFGGELDVPLDVHTPVSWCGYANEAIRDQVAPIVAGWLREHGVTEDDVARR